MAKIQYLKNSNIIIYPVTHERAVRDSNGKTLETKLTEKQNTLVSGVNIKTIEGHSILGAGDLAIRDGASVVFYAGSFYDSTGRGISFDSEVESYWILNTAENFGGSIAKTEDVILFFVNSILYVCVATSNIVLVSSNNYLQIIPIFQVNLKGDEGPVGPPGITSVIANVDAICGKPSVTTFLSDQVLTLFFSGLKGIQGNPGVNNATMVVVEELPVASAETIENVYLIYNENTGDYDRYFTQFDGETYSWVQAGSLTINLADYRRKDDDVWLTQEEFDSLEIKDITKVYNIYEESDQ